MLAFQSPIEQVEGGVLIRWLGREDETYKVERSVNLVNGGFETIATGIAASEYLDRDAGAFGVYRVKVDLE